MLANQGGYTPKSVSLAKDREELPVPLTEIQLVSAKNREEMSPSARQALDPELTMVIKYFYSQEFYHLMTRRLEN